MNDMVNFCPNDGYPFVLDESRCAICNIERSRIQIEVKKTGQKDHYVWRKILYEPQPFEDNYTDPVSFLKDLKKNANVKAYDYKQVALDSLAVTQQLSLISLLLIVFYHMINNHLDPYSLIMINTIMCIIGFMIWIYSSYNKEISFSHLDQWFSKLFYLINYIIGLYFLSPLLGTLTDHISDDTIIVLILILLIIHIVLQDYGFISPTKNQKRNFNAPVSLNAATFASVMLASRLQSFEHSFAIIAFSIVIFALFPFISNSLKKKQSNGSLILSISIIIIVILLLFNVSFILSIIYIITVLFITFVTPFCLQWIQKYKNEIHGPWDEAVPSVNRK